MAEKEDVQKLQLEISFSTPLRVISEPAPEPLEVRAITTIQIAGLTFRGENMSNTMTVKTYATLSVEWKDTAGNTVKVDGPTEWKSTDETILQATVATGNPQICNVYAPGKIGKVQVHATADADLGEGKKAVTATVDIEVISGEAVGGEIKFSQSGSQGPQATTGRPGGQPPRK